MLLNKLYKGSSEILKIYRGSTLVLDNTPVTDGLTPILTSFSVEDAQPTRVYFSTPSGYPDGMTTTGFVISGKTISSVTKVNDTQGYFTVSVAFTYWDKAITIRRESGDATIYDFTLQRVTNNISEITTTNTKYIAVGASGVGTIGDPANISTLASTVADTTVYIEFGNYGSQSITMANAGGATTPIKIIGYKTTPGDDPTLTRSIGLSFDSAEMPYITGTGTNLYVKDYTIVKNIQIENSSRADDNFAFRFDNASYVIFQNCYGIGGQDTFTGRGAAGEQRNALIGCYQKNAGQQGSWLSGKFNFIDDVFYCSSSYVLQDYACAFHGGSDADGGNNVIVNSKIYAYYVEGTASDISHGFSLKGANRTDLSPQDLKYSLIENCVADHVDQCFQFRHHTVGFNVVRNCTSIGTSAAASGGTKISAIVFREAAHDNVVENHYSELVYTGVYFTANTGEGLGYNGVGGTPVDQAGGIDNKLINCIWNGVRQLTVAAQTSTVSAMLPSTGNEWINCTFKDMQYFVNTGVDIPASNTVTNSILTSCPTFSSNANGQIVFDHNLMYSSFSRGTNVTTSNPVLSATYVPTATYGADLQAPTIAGVYYDANGDERDGTTTTRGAKSHADEVAESSPPIIIDLYPTGNAASATSEANSVANFTLSNGTRGEMLSSATAPYDGSYSIYTRCKITAAGNVNILSDNIAVTNGNTYRVTYWYKTNYTTVDSGQYVAVWGGVVTSPDEALTATVWTEKTHDVVANADNIQLRFYPARSNAVENGELYIDKITIEDIT